MTTESQRTQSVRMGTPFVDLFIADKQIPLLDTQPNGYLLKSFTYVQRTNDDKDIVQIEIIDPEWDRLESLLIVNVAKRDIVTSPVFSFRYGWRGVDDHIGNPYIKMFVLGWTVTLMPFGGSIIKIVGITQGALLSLCSMYNSFSPTDSISKVIEQVCDLCSVRHNIEQVFGEIGNADNRMDGLTPSAYIDRLIPMAFTTTGRSLIKSTHHFSNGDVGIRVSSITDDTAIISKNYTVCRDRDGECITFQSSYQGLIAAAFGTSAIALGFDQEKKDIKTSFISSSKAALAPILNIDNVWFEGLYSSVTEMVVEQLLPSPEQPKSTAQTAPPTRVWELPYANVGNIQAHANWRREAARMSVYPAEATVMGDISIRPIQRINFRVLKVNYAAAGQDLHQTSGCYQVKSVAHTITPGSFRTDLQLLRVGPVVDSVPDSVSATTSPDMSVEVQRIGPRFASLGEGFGA